MPSTNNFFPSAAEYTAACGGNAINRNCLKFAVGDTAPDPRKSDTYDIEPLPQSQRTHDSQGDLAKAFLHAIDHYPTQLNFDSSSFRRIDSLDVDFDVNETYIFKVYGFTEHTYRVFGCKMTYYDFHVMRGLRDTATGNICWEHKMGWDPNPSVVTTSDEKELDYQYGEDFVYLAFTPPQR